jgi:transcriptional regulator with XRE-family HTH domain
MAGMRFGERLENLREQRGISVRELARQIGDVSPNTVARWIAGGVEPRLDEAARAAALFGLRVVDMIEEEGPRSRDDLDDDESYLLRTYRNMVKVGIDADTLVQRMLGELVIRQLPPVEEPRGGGAGGSERSPAGASKAGKKAGKSR